MVILSSEKSAIELLTSSEKQLRILHAAQTVCVIVRGRYYTTILFDRCNNRLCRPLYLDVYFCFE